MIRDNQTLTERDTHQKSERVSSILESSHVHWSKEPFPVRTMVEARSSPPVAWSFFSGFFLVRLCEHGLHGLWDVLIAFLTAVKIHAKVVMLWKQAWIQQTGMLKNGAGSGGFERFDRMLHDLMDQFACFSMSATAFQLHIALARSKAPMIDWLI